MDIETKNPSTVMEFLTQNPTGTAIGQDGHQYFFDGTGRLIVAYGQDHLGMVSDYAAPEKGNTLLDYSTLKNKQK